MSESMNIYEICVTGWETYEPKLFESKLSKENFEKELTSVFKLIFPKLMFYDGTIGGHILLDELTNILTKRGCKPIKPNHVFDLYGECSYTRDCEFDKKPEFIPKDMWDAILVHNDKCREKLIEDVRKLEEKNEQDKVN